MHASASMELTKSSMPHQGRGVLWALLIAILFAAVAAISFAVDQTVTLSSLPTFQPEQTAGQ